MEYKFRKITIIVGGYGCGKTNLAVNMALDMAEKGKVCIVDMDIVNPYFRSADFRNEFEEKEIDILVPQYANTNLDIPVLNFDMESIIGNYDYVVLDVGGDDAGAYALGRYRNVFENHKDETEMLYVFSMYRSTTPDTDETVHILKDIEKASGMKCTAVVNNSNLGIETDDKTLGKSEQFAEEVCEKAGIPLAFQCSDFESDNSYRVKRMVKMPWE